MAQWNNQLIQKELPRDCASVSYEEEPETSAGSYGRTCPLCYEVIIKTKLNSLHIVEEYLSSEPAEARYKEICKCIIEGSEVETYELKIPGNQICGVEIAAR